MQNKLFKKSSVERFTSPEKLNEYIQVASPSSWMVLGAALALLLGMMIWGFFGELTESVSFTGLCGDGMLRCYVDNLVSTELEEGMEVSIVPITDTEGAESVSGRVKSIAVHPLSYEEATIDMEQDYLPAVLGISTWNIVVEVEPEAPLYEGMVYSLSAVIETRRPVDLVFQ